MANRLPIVIEGHSRTHRAVQLAVVLAVGLAVFAIPYVVAPFRLGQITAACVLAVAVVGMNLLSGWGGQISLGHAAFFGIGAYTTGILTVNEGVAAPVALLASVAVCFVVGVLLGFPALRVYGMYLAIITLAFGVLFPNVVRRFDDLTGGSTGLFGIQYMPPDNVAYFGGFAGRGLWLYWVTMATLAISCLVVWNLMRSRMGRAIVALRDNESAAMIMGVNRTSVRTVLFGISAAIAGLGGGMFAFTTGIITPDSFTLLLTIYFLMAMVLGGTASYWGPIVGGFAIYFVPIWTSGIADGPLAGVLFGVVVIALVFVLPSGLAGFLRKVTRKVVVVSPATPSTSGVGAHQSLIRGPQEEQSPSSSDPHVVFPASVRSGDQ